MNQITIKPISRIGFNFIDEKYLHGKNEYHLRNLQNRSGIQYRKLKKKEIAVLVSNNNTADDWKNVEVSDEFNPDLVKNCKFFGLVRIGKLETVSLEYHNVCLPVGLYNSTIISCDLGDNVIVSNVNYMSHYIVGNEVMLLNIDELHVTDHSKFGNGILKEGENESVRIWVEVCNENAGRKIVPFNGMLPGDAYLWSKYREDGVLMQQFKDFTEKKFDKQRGYYGKIGDRCVIKNTGIIKDVWIGSDAYIKGANKLKNITLNSSPEAASQIGEGCEIVNGIVGFGCRIFYGVKAVRFVMASHSQLKYGARLINSFLGNNSTISCCEVLNSLIFPGHEQHHNNSFLCAALVMGQSNIAAGATIGSNHNSRAADGEFITGRGFWPGLCVSLKHNSKFATFTLLAKGDYSFELNIPFPFSLVSNDESSNQLQIMPAYWFLYNLYALARNASKYVDRDKRTNKIQHIEYDFLGPDSINEIFSALSLLKKYTGQTREENTNANIPDNVLEQAGEVILDDLTAELRQLKISSNGLENSSRTIVIIKPREAYHVYKNLILYYAVSQMVEFIETSGLDSFELFMEALPENPSRLHWNNIGGQLMPQTALNTLLDRIRNHEIKGWDEVHEFYQEQGRLYSSQKLQHAFASLLELENISAHELTKEKFYHFLDRAIETREWMVKNIYESRSKDYQNAFRKMIYDNEQEMEQVIGKLDDNVFIAHQKDELLRFRHSLQKIREKMGKA